MLAPGTKLGPYEIVAPLGAGGMGEVYRARDARLGREVAVKVLPQAMASDAQALRRMEQEARTVAALNHPNLVSVYDIGAAPDGSPYVVMELLDGATLRQRLAAGGPGTGVGQRKAVEYAMQIARGLAAAHGKGIIHRDLKPENIFLCADGRVKILDFGLAKLSVQALADAPTVADGGAATAPGTVLGTYGYMAPEQVRGQPTDARSDIFSFGAVLYEMLTGRRAFAGDSAADVMSAILKEEPPEMSEPGTPPLDPVVRHCLEKEPQQRYQSASDIAFQLGSLSQASTSAGASGAVAALPAPGGRARRRWLFALAGSAGLVAAATGAFYWGSARGAGAAPRVERLTFQRGLISGARFLPGGQGFLVAANWNGESDEQLYTGRLAAPGLQLLNVANEEVAAVSPGDELLLLKRGADYEFGNAGELARMPMGSGAPRPTADNVVAAAWSPDGSSVALVRHNPQSNEDTLEYPAGHVLVRTPGWIGWPRFSPDGRAIAYLDHPVTLDDGGTVDVVDLEGRQQTWSGRYSSLQGLAWAPSGREVWFTASTTSGDRALFAAGSSGRVRMLYSAPAMLTLEDVDEHGQALVRAQDWRWTVLVNTAQISERDVSVGAQCSLGALSADGKQILVSDEATAPYATYLRSVDGGPPIRLGPGAAAALSPDGHWALSLLPTAPQQIMLLPIGAGDPRPLTHGDISYSSAKFLPDSQQVVAMGTLPGHAPRTYLITLAGGVTALTPEGVAGDLATPDGKFVLVRNPERQYSLYPLTGGAPQPVAAGAILVGDNLFRFGSSDDEVYAGRLAGGESHDAQLMLLNLRTGQRQVVAVLHPTDAGFSRYNGGQISQDGKVHAYAEQLAPANLYVISGLR